MQREKNKKEAARAEELGLELPKKVQKARCIPMNQASCLEKRCLYVKEVNYTPLGEWKGPTRYQERPRCEHSLE